MKRLFELLLSLSIVICMAVPAFAAGGDSFAVSSSTSVDAVSSAASAASDSSASSVAAGNEPAASSVPASTPAPVIWDKPFSDYTPTEGYLFLLFVLACVVVFYKIFEWGIFHV